MCNNIIFHEDSKDDKILETSLRTKVYLCAAHIIKNVVKKAKAITSNKEIRRAFTYAFSLLQDAQTKNDFIVYYENISFMFCLKYESSTALNFLRNELANRNLDSLGVDDDKIDAKKAKLLAEEDSNCDREKIKNIKKFSRFTKFFDAIHCN